MNSAPAMQEPLVSDEAIQQLYDEYRRGGHLPVVAQMLTTHQVRTVYEAKLRQLEAERDVLQIDLNRMLADNSSDRLGQVIESNAKLIALLEKGTNDD